VRPAFAFALALALTCAVIPQAVAQEEPKKETQAETIERLIKQLGAESYEERESAQKQLETIGRPAISALEAAKSSKDLEVVSRATDALLKIRGEVPPKAEDPKPDPTQRMPQAPDMTEVLKELERQMPGDVGKLFRRLFPPNQPGKDGDDEERRGDPLRPRVRTWTWSLGPDGKLKPGQKLGEKKKDLGATLGLGTGATGAALRSQLGLPRGGRVINRVTKGGYAARHGLQLYDVIVAVDGREVRQTADLEPLLRKKCKVEVYRKAKLQILELPSYASEVEKTTEKKKKADEKSAGGDKKQRSF
jgi:hypothetical protein